MKHLYFVFAVVLMIALCLSEAQTASAAMNDRNFVRLCQNGSVRQIQNALKDGANPNAKAKVEGVDGTAAMMTALMWAAMTNTPEVVSLLLKAGADPNAKGEDGVTALMTAAAGTNFHFATKSINKTPEVISLLLKAGADLNAKDESGGTALIVAAATNTPEVVSFLLKAGADVNAKRNNGVTALMGAIANKDPEVISLLLKAGADPNARGSDNKTALDLAREFQITGAVRVLEAAARGKPQTGGNASIAGDKVNVRSKPNTSSKVLKQLNTGHPVTIIRREGDWVRIRTASGTEGWVFGKFVALGGTAASPTASQEKSPAGNASAAVDKENGRSKSSTSSNLFGAIGGVLALMWLRSGKKSKKQQKS